VAARPNGKPLLRERTTVAAPGLERKGGRTVSSSVLYRILRWKSGIALRWFYRELEISGGERIPTRGPVLLAVNHPNALVDAIVAGQLTQRRLLLTAKATLFGHPVLRFLFRHVGIVPLRRASDEVKRGAGDAIDPARNLDAFRAVTAALEEGQAVLIFPEGKSHSEPALAPLRSGLARMALQARDAGVSGIRIVPVGLTFERKWRPRTRVVARVAEIIDLDSWPVPEGADPISALTRVVEQRIRDATINFASVEEAAWVVREARILAGIFDRPRPLGDAETPYADEVDVVRRIVRASGLLISGSESKVRVDEFLARLGALRHELDRLGIAANDVAIEPGLRPGAIFALREGAIVLGAGPIALWGRVNHWLPLRLARAIAMRQSRSPEDPAMYTLVVGLGLVLVAYVIQTAAVTAYFGALVGALYLLSLPVAATWDWRFRDRLRRARMRMTAWLHYQRDSSLQRRLLNEAEWLRNEALELERLSGGGDVAGGASALSRV
jgi:glycerol-3-phosphate O-acyltransferase / dihydroxyacetone phosphate acyltransferase